MTEIAFPTRSWHPRSSAPDPAGPQDTGADRPPNGAVDFRTGDDKIKVFNPTPGRAIPAPGTIR
jgi:hypothetical protein